MPTKTSPLTCYFNPPAPCGAGPTPQGHKQRAQKFQSTRPVRGGTSAKALSETLFHFNPPAPCGAGHPQKHFQKLFFISIHAPRAGRDLRRNSYCSRRRGFQSTRPVRGGTRLDCHITDCCFNFNPPAPCGAGLAARINSQMIGKFQSTRPVRGGTQADQDDHSGHKFQSTRPVRGGT